MTLVYLVHLNNQYSHLNLNDKKIKNFLKTICCVCVGLLVSGLLWMRRERRGVLPLRPLCLGNMAARAKLRGKKRISHSVCLHTQFNPIAIIPKAIVQLWSSNGQLQLSEWWQKRSLLGGNRAVRKPIHWPKHVMPGTIGGAVPFSASGTRATGWPLYVTSNNKPRRHSRKMFSEHLSKGRNNGAPEKWPEVNWQLKTSFSRRRSCSSVRLSAYGNNPFSSASRFNLDFRESKP